jgi:hypothetical protein
MSNPTIPQGPTALSFEAFKEAHASVVHTRDKLRMLAVMTQADNASDAGEYSEDATALAWCYARLSRELDEVVQPNAALPEELRN